MKFEARPGQESVLDAEEPVLVVLGGAGTGKTTVAAAVVRKNLDRQRASGAQPSRALFLSFSRAAVGQIVDRLNADNTVTALDKVIDAKAAFTQGAGDLVISEKY